MLNHRKFRKDLSIVHLDHALVDLCPASRYTRDIEKDRAVLPERAFLDVVNEADRTEVHVSFPLTIDDVPFGNTAWILCIWC